MVAQVTDAWSPSYGEVKWYEATLEAYDALACEGRVYAKRATDPKHRAD